MVHRYYEDIDIGEVYESDGITVTESQIIDMGLKFDPQPFHINSDNKSDSIFDDIVASGILTQAVCHRLAVDAIFSDIAMVAARGADKLRFENPVYPGDTIYVVAEVLNKSTDSFNSNYGSIDIHVKGKNQDDDPVCSYIALTIVEHKS